MSKINLALELGSSNTSIYIEGLGIVLKESSQIAFLEKVSEKNVIEAGSKVKKMQGKTSDKTIIVSPIQEGIITDKKAAQAMLKAFLKRVIKSRFLMRVRAIVCVPCGLTKQQRKDYETVCLKAGINEVILMESVIAAGLGIGLSLESSKGVALIDIGGGTTDIAVMSNCSIISGCSVFAGGIMMDAAIIEHIKKKYGLIIGQTTAERLKIEIGSLYSNDLAEIKVSGMDLKTQNPSYTIVTAKDIKEAIEPIYLKIAFSAESIINVCPPEIASDIYKNGIFLTGGAANILGIEQFLGSRLKIAVKVVTDASYAVILGAGKLLGDEQLLQNIFEQN
ncbi:MAG: rod shape-determining protein [Clostridiales bacterium]|nr:rod shape-determining protein [Clostridiales bacterium]